MVFSPFMAEAASIGYWESFLSEMKDTHGEEVAFWPMF